MARNDDDLDRRDALKLIAGGLGLAALGAEAAACAPTVRAASSEPRRSAAPAPDRFLAAPPMDTVRIGFVGVGGQGTAHVHNLLRVERSEEHTSELQSHSDLVCRLLLEKKKKKKK